MGSYKKIGKKHGQLSNPSQDGECIPQIMIFKNIFYQHFDESEGTNCIPKHLIKDG